MKRFVLTLILAVSALTSWAYSFSAVAPSGQTLYYNISGSTVSVTYPGSYGGSSAWTGYTQPTGSLTIPSSVTYSGTTYSVTSIGNYAFYGCIGLTSVTIPNSVTSIGFDAFENCSGLTSVTIPNSVTSILPNAFRYCIGLTSVTIPNSVTSIGERAFFYCSGLTSVNIPNSVTSIGERAFSYCSGLTTIIVDANNNRYDSRNNCNAVIATASNTLILGCKNTTIPNSVTSIGEGAFYGCSDLTSVTIPNSVTSIGSSAFYKCSGLTSVTIPNSVTSIGNYAFYECSGLTSVTIGNSVTSIGNYAFYYCDRLTTVTIPNSVTSIGDEAFYHCSGLTSVTIGNSVTSIGEYAFASCSGLTSVTIGNSVTSIGEYAFASCSGLTSVTIPNSVTSIGFSAFYDCSGLTSVTIGNSVTSIGNRAFYFCDRLDTIVCKASTPPTAGTGGPFYNVPTSCKVLVPCGSASAYRSAQYWNSFSNFIETPGYNLSVISVDRTIGSASVAQQPSCTLPAIIQATPADNYTFDHWSDNNTDNPRTITLTRDTSLVAYFQPLFTVHYASMDTLYGVVSEVNPPMAFSQREMGSTVELAATPKPGNRFFAWSDRCTDNPRSVTITQDTSVIAYFSPEPAVEYVHDTTFVDNYIHDTTIVHDTVFVTLFLRDSTIIYGSHDTIFVHDTVRDCHEQQLFVLVNNDTLGACAGSGSYPLGSTVQIMAIPNRGQRFLCWSDGVISTPRTITLTGNLTFTAIFLKQEE